MLKISKQFKRRGVSILLAVLLTALVGDAGRLVAQVGKATITGSVTDSSGAMLAGTAIEAKNTDTNETQSAITGPQGHYSILDLPIGNYEIQASKAGFKTVVHKGITLSVGSEPVVDFSLSVGSVNQSIAVEGQVSQVETQTSAVSSLVTPRQMSDLPLNGRNYEQLLTLAPGVSTLPQVPAGASGFSSAWYGNEANYSVSGSRPEGEAFLLDNTDISDFFNHGTGSGVAGTSLGVEAIAEFQLLTNTYSAQFGGTGAAMNAVTKSGTNDFHGSAYDYLRNSALDSRGYFDGPKVPPYRRNQFGGSIGGPVKKDKLFFFSNYEGLRSILGVTNIAQVPEPYVAAGMVCSVNPQIASPGATSCPTADLVNVGFSTSPAVAAQIQGMLAIYPTPTPGSLDLGNIANYKTTASLTTEENYFLERIDYTLSPKDSLFGRYVNDRVTLINPFAGSVLPLWADSEHTANQYITLEEKRLFSPTKINLIRFSFVRTHANATTTGETPPLDLFPGSGRPDADVSPGGGVSQIGSNSLDPFVVIQNKFNVGDDFFWSRGAHSFKIGVSLPRVQTNLSAPFLLGGDFSFGVLQNFLLGDATGYLGTDPPSPAFNAWRYFRQIDFFPYFQDDWKVSSRLTLNLGLRWNFATNAVGVGVPLNAVPHPLTDTGFTVSQHVLAKNPNWLNLDPRIGLAFDPFANHKTSIRAGFGMFHEQIEARTTAPNYYLSPPSGAVLIFSPPGTFVPFPNPYSAGALPFSQFLGVSYATDTAPYAIQYNLTVQHEVAGGIVLSIGYVGSSGVHLFSIYDQNLPKTTTGSPVGAGTVANPFTGMLTNPDFGSLNDTAPISHSSYNSLQLSATRQFSQSWQVQASYTYSKSLDDGSVTSSPEVGTGAANAQGGSPITNPYNHSADRGPSDFNRGQNLSVNGLYSLPFSQNRLVAGWQATTILSASSGIPLDIEDGFTQSLTNGIEYPRPNYSGAPGCKPSQVLGKVDEWYNPQCYSLQALGTEGNVGRDSVYGPGLLDLDFSVIKHTKITERINSEFRAEFFNLINHTNLGPPAGFVFVGAAGEPQAYNPTAGQITSLSTTPRQIQFALKLTF